MEYLILFLRSFFSLFDRRNLKKYIGGKIEPNEEELVKKQNFLQQNWGELVSVEEEKNYKKRLNREFEQKKIFYFNDFLVDELNFLFRNQIGLNEMLDIFFAKGGMVKGIASIKWDEKKQRYTKRFTFFGTIGLLIYIVFVIVAWSLMKMSFGFEYAIFDGIKIFPILATVSAIFLLPVIFLGFNAEDAKKRLVKNHPEIF